MAEEPAAASPSPPPPPSGGPQATAAPPVSPDGRNWWDGTQWRPIGPQWELRRNAAPYVLASVVVPGLGSILAGRWRRGAIILAASVVVFIVSVIVIGSTVGSAVTQVTSNPSAFNCGNLSQSGVHICSAALPIGLGGGAWLLPLFLLATAIWVVGLVDAARSVAAWNRSHGLPG